VKGFLRKDLYLTIRYCRSIFLIVIVFAVIGCYQGENYFFILYPAIMVSLVSVSLLSFDEREHFCAYAATMPVPRSVYVTAKYLLGLGYGIVCVIFILLLQFFSGHTTGRDLPVLSCILFFLVMLTPAVTLPFMFKFGVEKGRMVYYIMLGFSVALSLLAMKYFNAGGKLSDSALFLPVGAFAVILFVCSWRLSIRFYSKREF